MSFYLTSVNFISSIFIWLFCLLYFMLSLKCNILYIYVQYVHQEIWWLRSPEIHCFKFPRIFRQIDVVRRGTSANRHKYSGIFFRCIWGYFPVYLRIFSSGFLSPTNFSHKFDVNFPPKKCVSHDSNPQSSGPGTPPSNQLANASHYTIRKKDKTILLFNSILQYSILYYTIFYTQRFRVSNPASPTKILWRCKTTV